MSNNLINTSKVFWQFIINNTLRTLINISKIKIYNNTFFKNFFNKSILVSKVKKFDFLE